MGAYTVNQPPGYNFANVDYGFIDERGEEIAWAYECASDFNEGRAAVKSHGLWSFIDLDGKVQRWSIQG